MQLIHIYYMGSKTGSQNSFLCRFNRWNIASMFFTGDCGNDLLMNLPMARWEAAKYLHEVLEQASEENLTYPAAEA